MGHLIIITCILSSLLSMGHSLTCVVCRVEGGESCTGDERNCPKDYVCASTSTIKIMDGLVTRIFTRSCERRNTCGVSGSIGYQRGNIKTATSCCFTDSCSTSAPALPLDNAQRNGMSCRSCTSHDSTWCHTSETIDCTGEENKCIFQTEVYSGAKYSKNAVRGCATKGLCDIGSQSYNFGAINLRTEITCSNDAFNLHFSLLLLVITVLISSRLML